jgi:hypothetical protein
MSTLDEDLGADLKRRNRGFLGYDSSALPPRDAQVRRTLFKILDDNSLSANARTASIECTNIGTLYL